MIMVRTVFHAHFGKAGELAKEMVKEFERLSSEQPGRWRVLTDLSGRFDTVVMESEFESLAAWERARKEMFERQDFQEEAHSTYGLIESGYQEHFTIEGQG